MKLYTLVLGALFVSSGAVLADTLTIKVGTISSAGTIRAALYDSQSGFDSNKVISGASAVAQEGTAQLIIQNIKPGTYGIALFHDLNGNEELDRNLLGAPNEPFGFSNNPKIGFSAPSFDEFKFNFDGSPAELEIQLNGN